MSKYFEGLGDKWATLLNDPAVELEQLLPFVVNNGGLREGWEVKTEKRETVTLAWPAEGTLRAGVTLRGTPGQQLKPMTLFPLLEGVGNDMTVEEVIPWENGTEAFVSARRNEDGEPLLVYTPFFYRDADILTPGVRHTFLVAGLAYGVRKALLDEMTITEGPQYDTYAAEWLRQNPDASRLDVPQLCLSLQGARILSPGRMPCDYQLRAPITHVEETMFGPEKVYILQIELGLTTENPLRFVLFAPEKVCGSFVPVDGAEIDAMIWLQARVIDI